jgi:hypothetical protein
MHAGRRRLTASPWQSAFTKNKRATRATNLRHKDMKEIYKAIKVKGGWVAAGNCGGGHWLAVGNRQATRAKAVADAKHFRRAERAAAVNLNGWQGV